MEFDLLIKGGDVVDPGTDTIGRFDVGVKRNRIKAVEANIPAESSVRVIDASGQYVTPGLVDLHTHVYEGVTYWGVNADTVGARSGVTTWLDVGSAGGFNLMGFREFIARPALSSRIYSLLNISSIGLTASTWELANLGYCDVDFCCQMTDLNRDLVLGIKVRMDLNTTSGTGLEPLHRAREAADRRQLPLMVHIGSGPPTLEDVLGEMLGDILTHCFTPGDMRITDQSGSIVHAAQRAWDMGIVMDVGHGGGSFSFEVADALMSAGYRPDVISSDLHQNSIHGPAFDLPTCLSKFLMLGMSFEQVIETATSRPATVLGLQDEIGTLKPGAYADIALFTIEEGEFPLYDVTMAQRTGSQLIRNTLTIVNGREMRVVPDAPPAPWIELSKGQHMLIEQGHTPDEMVR